LTQVRLPDQRFFINPNFIDKNGGQLSDWLDKFHRQRAQKTIKEDVRDLTISE